MSKLMVFLLAALTVGSALAQGVTPTKILIGQSTPLSGDNERLGQDIRNGALAYFKKVNDAGGVHGRKIELVTLDDGNAVPRAEQNTTRLIEEEGVFALFGYASATLSRLALPLVEKHKVPFMSPFTGADPMRIFNKYVYNVRASYADELEKIVDHFGALGMTRFAIVHYDDLVGKENLNAVQRALKKRNYAPVAVAAFKNRTNPDIDAGLKDIANGQPDVVILTTLYKTTADFVKAAREAGVYAQMASNSFPGAGALADELGKDGAGVIVATVVPPYTRGAVPIVNEYRTAMDRQFLNKKVYSFTSLESYIGAKIMVEAMRRAGRNLTREVFMKELDGMAHYDVGGYEIGFSPKNHNGSSFVELTVLGKNRRFVH